MIILVGTGLQSIWDYKNNIKSIHTIFEQVETSNHNSIINSLWTTDNELLHIQLEGILQLRDIQYIEIRKGTEVLQSVGTPQSENILEHTIPLVFMYNEKDVYLGDLHLIASLNGISERIFNKVLLNFGMQAIYIFLVSLLIIIFFYTLVGKHLISLASFTESIRYESIEQTFILDRKSRAKKPDELEQLVISFNQMQQNLAQDITDRNQFEKELLIAMKKAEESDRLKSAFLSNMSHEIRTPMNGIMGFAGLLKKPNLNGEEQKKYISIIESSGNRMLNIINNIISISKIESGQMEVNIQNSNINDQIEYIYNFFKPEIQEKGLEISFSNSLLSEEAILKTDREKVYSILTNLVKNAIKFTKKGIIEFGYIKKGKYLEFYVKDTGIGVKEERQKAIFERFIQADITDHAAYQGAGLGLSISKAYVEMLGGKIWIKSKPGIGSIFYFTLPYESKSTKNTKSENTINKIIRSDELKSLKNLKILLVEDDEISEKLISISLQYLESEIITVGTGEEAVASCRSNPDFDLVLMDIQMPGVDGYKASQQIRKFNKNVIIIAQTAYAFESDREKAIASGCDDYLSKPIKIDELKKMIIKYFEKK